MMKTPKFAANQGELNDEEYAVNLDFLEDSLRKHALTLGRQLGFSNDDASSHCLVRAVYTLLIALLEQMDDHDLREEVILNVRMDLDDLEKMDTPKPDSEQNFH